MDFMLSEGTLEMLGGRRANWGSLDQPSMRTNMSHLFAHLKQPHHNSAPINRIKRQALACLSLGGKAVSAFSAPQ